MILVLSITGIFFYIASLRNVKVSVSQIFLLKIIIHLKMTLFIKVCFARS